MSHFDRIRENINILRYNVGVTQTIEDVKKYEDDPEKMSNFSLSRMTSPGFSEWQSLESNPDYECKDGVCRLKKDSKEKDIPDMRRRFKSDEIFGKRFQTDLISPFNGPMFMNRELNPSTSEIREKQDNINNQLPETYTNPIRVQHQPSMNPNVQSFNQNNSTNMSELNNSSMFNQNFMNNDFKYNTSSYSSWQSDMDNTYNYTMNNHQSKLFNKESNYVEGGTKLFRTN